MYKVQISGTGLYTPKEKISNEELVQSFNKYVDEFNEINSEDIKNGNFLKSSLFGTDVPHIIENKNSIVAIYEPYNENKFKPQKVLI